MSNYKKDISLVLGGGSALGLAHIGAISVIEQHFNIRSIVGTSMGAMVGGFYAAGWTAAQMVDFVNSLKPMGFLGLIRIGLPGGALLDGSKLENMFREKLGNLKIEQLPIKFAAVSFDVISQRTVIITKGNLAGAMRATCALPFIFEPFYYCDFALVDGSIEYPLPLAFGKIFDRYRGVVAVNVLPEVPTEPITIELGHCSKSPNIPNSFLYTSLHTTINNQAFMALSSVIEYKPRVFINAYDSSMHSWDMDKADRFFEIGAQAAEKAISEIKETPTIIGNIKRKLAEIRAKGLRV